MDIKENLLKVIREAAEAAIAEGVFPDAQLPTVILEVPPKKELGDFATNIAMQSAKAFRMNPRMIAEELVKRMSAPWLERVEIAGPGFINFFLQSNVIYQGLASLLAKGEALGQLPAKEEAPIQVEYVSANPTGPLHIGHGRGAAAGSALVNVLRAAGHNVVSEYYINDAGNQIDNLALSVEHRYLELLGKAQDSDFPENGYHGADIIDTAKRIIATKGDIYLAMDQAERLAVFKELALKEKLAALREDLEAFNCSFDIWYSERTLHPDKVKASCEELQEKGGIYEKDGALWLGSTAYGDDKDRVVIRDNGIPTYLAADIAYHRDKYERGFGRIINIWGADHHGYVCRVKAAMSALGLDAGKLEVLLLQMVRLLRGGQMVKLSKRTGQTVTLAELIEEVGTDAARYFFIMRSMDSQLDFDLDLAKSRSNENPVYYIQYAHARICSILRQTKEAGIELSQEMDLTLLQEPSEIQLINKLMEYEEEIGKAAAEYAPQRIARYVYELSGMFHSFYNQCRILGAEEEVAKARLALVTVAAHVIRHSLGILGISAPEKM